MLIIFIISSCEKEEFVPGSIITDNLQTKEATEILSNNRFINKKIPTVELLSNNKNFQKLNKLLINHINLKKDYNQIKKLSSKTNITNLEVQQLLLSLGYNNEQEFITFITEIQHINNLLKEEFDFTNLKEEEKATITIAAFQTIEVDMEYIDDGAGGGDSCYQTYTYCHQEAISEFKMDTFFCALGGIGIGAISTPIIGIGAGVYCYDYARDKFNAKVNLCYNDYMQCVK